MLSPINIPVYSTLIFSERRIPFCGNGLYGDGPEMRGFAKTLYLAIAVDHPTCFYQVYLGLNQTVNVSSVC